MRPRANFGPSPRLVSQGLLGLLLACGSAEPSTTTTPGFVVVDPPVLSIVVGASYPLTARGRDHLGDSIGTAQMHWTSSDPSVVWVSGTGGITALKTGTAVVTATNGAVSDASTVTVLPSGATSLQVDPPTATVEVGSSAPFQAILRDGNGQILPTGAVTWTSDQPAIATIAANGVATGISAGTATLRAVSAGFSATSRLTVTAPNPPTVSSVSLSPTSVSMLVGDVQRFSATPRTASGAPISGLPVSWSTLDPAVATVGSDGAVQGVATGSTRVVAEVAGVSGSAPVDVITVHPSPGTWPNEPSGYSVVTDQPWNLLDLVGWVVQFGTASLGLDLTAPASPPSVLTITYPIGFAGGEAPGTLTRTLPGPRRVFAGLWWKPSDPWQGHETNVNKIQFLFPRSGGDMTMVMYGPRNGPWELRVIPQFPGFPSEWLVPNVTNLPVRLGEWHQIEWLVDYGDQVGTGTVKWWMDGVLIGDYSGVPFPDAGMDTYKISPTWGGVGDTKQELDYFWFDQTYVSVR